jgi:hypothetical protein
VNLVITEPGYRWWTLTYALGVPLAMVMLVVCPPSDPGYGGSTFAWGLVFAFPMMGLALILCLIATLRVLLDHRWKMRSDRWWNALILVIALAPAVVVTTAYFQMRAHQAELLKAYEERSQH